MTDSRERSVLTCIALDIGGVLVADYWESVILDENVGLWRQLGIDRTTAAAAGSELWKRHFRRISTAEEYWAAFATKVGMLPTRTQIERAESAIWIDPSLDGLIDACEQLSISVSLVTDNTSFWLERQTRLLPALNRIVPAEVFVSSAAGVGKQTRPSSLYDLLATKHAADETLVVDDKARNLHFASELGFRTLLYKKQPRLNVRSVIGPYLE